MRMTDPKSTGKMGTGMRKEKAALDRRLLAYSTTAVAALITSTGAHASGFGTITGFTNLSGNDSPSSPPSISFHGKKSSSAATEQFSAGPFQIQIRGIQSFKSAGSFQNSGQVIQPNFNQLIKFTSTAAHPYEPANLAHGDKVAGGDFFKSGFLFAHFRASSSSSSKFGEFIPTGANATKKGYIGLEASKGSKHYYGWLKLQVKNNSDGHATQINFLSKSAGVFGAFSTGTYIRAGETVIPEPTIPVGGLALLALGVAGIREMRRRRQAQETATLS